MGAFDPQIWHAPAPEQLWAFIDDHRALLAGCLDGLSEAEARARLVTSKTTLLGLVNHATFVEQVWFDEAITGRPRPEIGIPEDVDASFDLAPGDTIASVQEAYAAALISSRARVAGLGLDDIVTGNRRGPLPLRFVLLHVLRELAQHCGHADILREQLLAARAGREVSAG